MKVERLTLVLVLFFVTFFRTYGKNDLPTVTDTTMAEESPIIFLDPSAYLVDSIVDFAMQLLGTPYVPAGCGVDGFDCSGLVNFVFNRYGIKVPRISREFEHFGTEIPIEEAQKGDVLLFLSSTKNVINHVGIITEPKGIESQFIHAASGRDRQVRISTVSTKGYTWRVAKVIRVF
ncbi:MAG: C40 family peptidase [Chitinophagales bacterium]